MGVNKRRIKIPQKQKVIAELQQEVGSHCPLCPSTDVGVFEVHHIDEDPSNNEMVNLLLLCPTCHSKVEKKEITIQQVRTAKLAGANTGVKIEFVSAIIDGDNCCWVAEKERCFYKRPIEKSKLPIIGFTLINHFPATVVMHHIRIFVKHLPSGLAGIPQGSPLHSAIKYRLCLRELGENVFPLTVPLQIPAGVAAKFDTEIFTTIMDDIEVAPIGRKVLFFVFDFNGKLSLHVPPIFLNCKEENEPLTIRRNIR